jgi:hypothetical protein
MVRYSTRLLTPPREEEEIYPYRRVWPSLIIEMTLLFSAAAGLFALDFVGFALPEPIHAPLSTGLALLPAGLWAIFSLWREQRVMQPRRRLLIVFVVSALAANALGVPFLDQTLDVTAWLSLTDTVERLLGYAFTLGAVQELIKYLILRWTIWPDDLRTRLDTVAYASACAVGYATVINLHFVLDGFPPPDVAASRVCFTVTMHLVATCIVSYGLAQLRFSPTSFVLLPFTMLLALLFTGVGTAVRAGLINAGFSLGISAPNALFALVLAFTFLVAPMTSIAFVYVAAERRQQESEMGGDV